MIGTQRRAPVGESDKREPRDKSDRRKSEKSYQS